MSATLSILGLYNFDNTIFDGMKIPEGINRDNVINTILSDCAELEIVYTSAPFIKVLITIWSENMLFKWTELEKTLHFEYNPIENYDRKENWNDHGNSVGKVSGFDSNELINSNGSDTEINRDGRIHGNIGVTTTQAMIKEQREIVNFNIVQSIADDFKQRFCLLIY